MSYSKEQLNALSIELRDWLTNRPSNEDLLEYVKRVPTEVYPIIQQTGETLALSLPYEVRKYFADTDPLFSDKLSFASQLYYLNAFVAYNSHSVCMTIAKEEGLDLDIERSDLPQFAQRITELWDKACYFGVLPQLLNTLVLAQSINTTIAADVSYGQCVESVSRLVLSNSQRVETNTHPNAADIQNERSILAQFTFLPREYIDSLYSELSLIERIDYFERLHTSLVCVQSYRKLVTDPERVSLRRYMWVFFKDAAEQRLLNSLETEYLNKKPEASIRRQLLQDFLRVLTTQAVAAKQMVPLYMQLLKKYGSYVSFEQIKEQFAKFVRESDIAEEILTPLDVYSTINRLAVAAPTVERSVVEREIIDQIAVPDRPIAEDFIHQLNDIFALAPAS